MVHAAYLMHLSDGSIRNGLTNREEHNAALKLNLLIFDFVTVSAPALLRNHWLFDALVGTSDESYGDLIGLRTVYEKGLIRPMIFTENQGAGNEPLITVSQNIQANEVSGVGLSDPLLKDQLYLVEQHAKLISESKIKYYKVEFEKKEYGSFISEVVEHVTKESKLNIPTEVAFKFIRQLETASARDPFRVADAYAIAERIVDPQSTICRALRSLSFTAMEWLAYPEALHQFAVSGRASVYSDECTLVFNRGLGPKPIDIEYLGGEDFTEELKIGIPIGVISALSFEEIIDARERGLIKSLRKLAAGFRDSPGDRTLLHSADDWCQLERGFRKWLAQETSVGRRGYLENYDSAKDGLLLKRVSDGSGAVGISILADVMSYPLAAVLVLGARVAAGHALGATARTNTVAYRPPLDAKPDDLRWDPRTGSTE